jgi:catechol 2,3-dioxygenase-like lactoylglutathione lyase family enzyme
VSAEAGGLGIERVDFVGIPSQNAERARSFYADVLELEPDPHAKYEFRAGETTLSIWEPERAGLQFEPSRGYIALRVPDVAEARAKLEAKGVEFPSEILDTTVCHMAFFRDPDGNELMLHRRYAPYAD